MHSAVRTHESVDVSWMKCRCEAAFSTAVICMHAVSAVVATCRMDAGCGVTRFGATGCFGGSGAVVLVRGLQRRRLRLLQYHVRLGCRDLGPSAGPASALVTGAGVGGGGVGAMLGVSAREHVVRSLKLDCFGGSGMELTIVACIERWQRRSRVAPLRVAMT